MRIPRMSGNAWVCTIIGFVLLASGAEQGYHAWRGDLGPKSLAPPPPKQDAAPKLGAMAPEFDLPDGKGGHMTLARFRGKRVVVNFFCGCSKCREFARQEAVWQRKEHVPMVALVFFDPAKYKDFQKETGIAYPMVYDAGKSVGKRYGSLVCPKAWVISGDGKIIWWNGDMPQDAPPGGMAAVARAAYRNGRLPDEPATAGKPPAKATQRADAGRQKVSG